MRRLYDGKEISENVKRVSIKTVQARI